MTLLRTSIAALSLLSLATVQAAENARTAYEQIISAGYVAPYKLEHRFGLWTAAATSPEGTAVSLLLEGGKLLAIDTSSFGNSIMSAADIRSSLQAKGFRQIDEIEFDDSLWTAEVLEIWNTRLDVWIHPVSGEILHAVREDGAGAPAGTLNANEITNALLQAGYRNIRGLEIDDGYWEADAINAAGIAVELRIDPYSGTVLKEKRDD